MAFVKRDRRLLEHNAGKTVSTKPHIPYEIIYKEVFKTKTEALKREKQIKKSGKLRKEIKHGSIWRHRLSARTHGSHPCKRGSIPLGATKKKTPDMGVFFLR